MKVILLQDVDKLGKTGDVKEVKNGYGFNFLLPGGWADFATPGAVRNAQKLRAKNEAERQAADTEYRVQAATLAGKEVVIRAKTEKGKLFGSVGPEAIAHALADMGIALNPRLLVLEKPFRTLGTFPVTARFSLTVTADFTVTIEAG